MTDFLITAFSTAGCLFAICILWIDAAYCLEMRHYTNFAKTWAVIYFFAGLAILTMLWRW